MQIEFTGSFAKDLKKITEKSIRKRIEYLIGQIEQSHSLKEISGVVKIQSVKVHFRLRVGDYRLGIVQQDNVILFVRCLHRKDIYRFFP